MKFIVGFNVIERTWRNVEIEADSAEHAVELVEQHEFDNSEAWEVDSTEWSISDAEVIEELCERINR